MRLFRGLVILFAFFTNPWSLPYALAMPLIYYFAGDRRAESVELFACACLDVVVLPLAITAIYLIFRGVSRLRWATARV